MKKVLISGGGIAGLTLASLLHEKGWNPTIIERDPFMRTEGYMMYFFGTGWDVAERIGITDSLRAIHYPIKYMQYVNHCGEPCFTIPIDRVEKALNGRYVCLRRSDLERILFERASSLGLRVRFGTTIHALNDTGSDVRVEFKDGSTDVFALVFGADGVHSRVRELVFGPENQFDRFLGYYVTAFHVPNQYGIGNCFKIYEEPDRVTGFYPLDEKLMETIYVFRHPKVEWLSPEERMSLVKNQFQGAGWISERVLSDIPSSSSTFFDSLTQIAMPTWSQGRVVLLGDACGCLTLLSVQGSHMAMAGAYVITHELERFSGEYRAAFSAYEAFLKPFIIKKQKGVIQFSHSFVPSYNSKMRLRHAVIRLIFSRPFIRYGLPLFGLKSILRHYNI